VRFRSNLDLLLLDAAADMDAEEQAALEASIARGLAEADRGELHSIEEVLARLRRI
jgi:predicted transcriptional regulator